MDARENISRREFIRTSVVTGGALLVSSALPGQARGLRDVSATDGRGAGDGLRDVSGTDGRGGGDGLRDVSGAEGQGGGDGLRDVSTAEGQPGGDGLLKGVCDIHLHCRPDSRERSVDEYGFTRDAMAAGYRAVMFKSNDFSCHDRAYLVRQALPGAACFGSLCMNRVHGDRVNPFAARKAVETSGGLCRCIWMPTLDADFQYRSEGRRERGIPVLDDGGGVLPEVVQVMEICAEAGIIFATGHASPEESLVLVRKAREVGVERVVVTHANSYIWTMTPDQIRQCIDLGAYIEYCYLPCLWGEGSGMPQYVRQRAEEFAAFVRIDPSRSFVSTDLGQAVMPHPLEGMRDCLLALRAAGVPQADIDRLVRTNPAWLIGLDQ